MLRIVSLIVIICMTLFNHINQVGQSFLQRLPSKAAILTYEDKVYMGFSYKHDQNFWIEFASRGPNQLMGISKFILTPHDHTWTAEAFAQVKKEELLDACTDWIGPYMVRKGFRPSSVTPNFTGGWHALEQDTLPTARTIHYTVVGVSLVVVNRIQGYNTTGSQEDILEEHVTYTLTNRGIQVQVTTKALTDCTIERYYGLQSQNSFHDGDIIYRSSEETPYPVGASSQALAHKDVTQKDYAVYAGHKHRLQVILDTDYGLGKGHYLAEDTPYAFTVNYKKSYFNLINGRSLFLKKDETMKWRGEYSFQYIHEGMTF
ncbi:hypothetical protein HZI73_22990 [Vallitalea pronyensis]|uniref:Uncharacterized protein n=1 Tax=Vallitalea pronyensis TaxID=1348613 RepID=A0A8J8MND1_9FIRM|nr:hypothetical protein [Vallitalea pronyensis]QUI24980.1 hypothetical protein HZI73_22990 [Vallitalea pronyensis]